MNIFLRIKGKKEVIKDFLFFQFITVIIFFSFIGKHFSVDTYFLFFSNIDNQYSIYDFVISSGRLIPGTLYLILEKSNINIVQNQILIFIIGLFIFAISAQIFYITALKVFKNQNKKLVFLLSIIFYLSVFIGGMAIFPIYFSLFQFTFLFLSLAFKFLEQEKFFLSIFFAVLSLFVYQAWFPLFLVIFFVYRTLKLNKSVISSLILTVSLYLLGFGLNYLFIKIYTHLFNFSPNNRTEIGLSSFLDTLKLLQSMIYTAIIITFGHFSKYYFVKMILVMLVIMMYSLFTVKQKLSRIKYSTVTFFSILMLTILPLIPSLFAKNHWVGDRYVLATGSMIGVLYFLFLFLNSSRYAKMGILLLIIFYLTSMIYTLNNEALILREVNKKDKYLVEKYMGVINNYQKKTEIEIKNVEFAKDKNPKWCRINKCTTDLSISSFMVDWSDLESLNYYGKRLFRESNNLDKSYCKNRDWDDFSQNQLIFKDESVLICVY